MGNFLYNVTATDDTDLYNGVGRVDDRVPSISRSFGCCDSRNLVRTFTRLLRKRKLQHEH